MRIVDWDGLGLVVPFEPPMLYASQPPMLYASQLCRHGPTHSSLLSYEQLEIMTKHPWKKEHYELPKQSGEYHIWTSDTFDTIRPSRRPFCISPSLSGSIPRRCLLISISWWIPTIFASILTYGTPIEGWLLTDPILTQAEPETPWVLRKPPPSDQVGYWETHHTLHLGSICEIMFKITYIVSKKVYIYIYISIIIKLSYNIIRYLVSTSHISLVFSGTLVLSSHVNVNQQPGLRRTKSLYHLHLFSNF